jgi:energy-converting hydrogenase Eha subunit A
MKSSSKVLLVLAGYLAALAIASMVVSIYVAATEGPDRQSYGGMFAFGDSILFLGVFVLAALPATGTALFFLRPYHAFWRLFAAGALLGTTTGILALANFLPFRYGTIGSTLGAWSMLAPLRILLAPALAIVFLISGLFSPTRWTRIAFLSATAVETVVFVWVALIWFHPDR